jgi:RNA polymerase sigma-70 factor (ECF subfamily)
MRPTLYAPPANDMSLSDPPAPDVWFGGLSDADPVDPAYPLRAIQESAESAAALSGAADRELVAAIRRDDGAAFERLYRDQARDLIGYAFRLCGARAMAQDVVADLFVHLWQHRHAWAPRTSVRAYLFTAVRHRVANARRAERRADARAARAITDPTIAAVPPRPDSNVDLDADLAMVWRTVDAFPSLRRQVVYLRWARGLSAEEVGAVVGISRNSVDKHLSRAMQAIRAAVPHLIVRK